MGVLLLKTSVMKLIVFGLIQGLLAEFSSEGGKFVFDLECQTQANVCSQVKEGLLLSARFIENVIQLKRAIVVRASYSKMVSENPQEGNLIGFGSGNQVYIEQGGAMLYCAQALYKQLPEFNPSTVMEYHDIGITLNSTAKLMLPGDLLSQASGGYSMIDVVCHEILHGMGILSGFKKDGQSAALSPYSAPYTFANRQESKFVGNAFNKHIYTTDGTSIYDLIQQMNSPRGSYGTTYKDTLNQNQMLISNHIEKYATTPGGMFFLTKDKKRIPLETSFRSFAPAGSIHHLDSRYSATHERLFVANARIGEGTHNHVDKSWVTAPFGDLSIAIMETMGYTRNRNSKLEKSLSGYILGNHRNYLPDVSQQNSGHDYRAPNERGSANWRTSGYSGPYTGQYPSGSGNNQYQNNVYPQKNINSYYPNQGRPSQQYNANRVW